MTPHSLARTDFQPALPTPPGMRVRTGRFTRRDTRAPRVSGLQTRTPASHAFALPTPVAAQCEPLPCRKFRVHVGERGAPKLQRLKEVDIGEGQLGVAGLDDDGDKVTMKSFPSRTGAV